MKKAPASCKLGLSYQLFVCFLVEMFRGVLSRNNAAVPDWKRPMILSPSGGQGGGLRPASIIHSLTITGWETTSGMPLLVAAKMQKKANNCGDGWPPWHVFLCVAKSTEDFQSVFESQHGPEFQSRMKSSVGCDSLKHLAWGSLSIGTALREHMLVTSWDVSRWDQSVTLELPQCLTPPLTAAYHRLSSHHRCTCSAVDCVMVAKL